MKQILIHIICVAAVVLGSSAHSGEQPRYEYLDAPTWLAKVEEVKNHGGTLSEWEQYDPRLLREYFLTFKPRPGNEIKDQLFKLGGLASYGEGQDLAEIELLVGILTNQLPEADDLRLYSDVVRAREGDANAMARIADARTKTQVGLLAACRTQRARDHLARIAQDSQLGFDVRSRAVEALVWLRDNRSLEIAISKEFIEQASREVTIPYSRFLWQLTGLDVLENLDIDSPDKLREYMKENRISLHPIERKLSVRGGIDWTKVKWRE